MDILSKLQAPEGSRTADRRVGRGPGSGLGKTGGRGQKGQKARSKGNINKKHFQGGQTPIQRRIAKRGFRVPFPIETVVLNLNQLERFADGTTVDEAALRAARLVQGRDVRIKILAGGELTKKLTVHAHGFSAKATEKIEQAKGKAVVIAEPTAAASPEA